MNLLDGPNKIKGKKTISTAKKGGANLKKMGEGGPGNNGKGGKLANQVGKRLNGYTRPRRKKRVTNSRTRNHRWGERPKQAECETVVRVNVSGERKKKKKGKEEC